VDPFGCSGCGVVWRLRFYRGLVALCVGSLLGVAGSLIQYSVSNPLASPSILGLPQGALTAMGLAIIAAHGVPPMAVSLLAASLGALMAYWASVTIASRAGGTGLGLVVSGLAVSTALGGSASLLLFLAQSRYGVLASEALLGTYAYSTLHDAVIVVFAAAVGVPSAVLMSRMLDALSYGDDLARGMGFNPWLSRVAATGAAAVMVAVTIYVAGIVGFLGLIAPHSARMTLGSQPRRTIAGSAVAGAVLSLAADVAARMLAPLAGLGELPVGVITSLVGGMFLAVLLARQRL